MSNEQWTVERALREGRADLLRCAGYRILEIRSPTYHPESGNRFWVYVDDTEHGGVVEYDVRLNAIPTVFSVVDQLPEPDGPPRDWPSIWWQQLREHIERAPMIPREYVQEVLDLIDFCTVKESLPLMEEDEVKL